jgi:hypothetical protein
MFTGTTQSGRIWPYALAVLALCIAFAVAGTAQKSDPGLSAGAKPGKLAQNQ